jgi:SAM-dependent methyltransferase
LDINQVKEFYDGYIDKLNTVKSRHQWVFNSIDRLIPQNISVLDLGCGTGITSKHLACGGRDVVGVDLSPVLIQHAKTYNSHFNAVEYCVSDIKDFKSTDKFDAIIMVDVLEHVLTESLPDLFQTLSSLSHKDTKIYLNIPSGDVMNWLWKNKPDTRQIVDNAISTERILELFLRIGFVPIYFQLYWQHYVEYLFVTKEVYHDSFMEVFLGCPAKILNKE